ncbi:MAG: molybdenum hydroxylase [bacterium]
MSVPLIVLIKSAHDIGSAIAHRIKSREAAAILLESPSPGATRGLMSFAAAVHEGRAVLEGQAAIRYDDPRAALDAAERAGEIPLLVGDLDGPLPLDAQVMVDARMLKKSVPPLQIDLAPLTIGIGPGFVAGEHVHAVIESNWGERLGTVIREGAAEAYTGTHRKVEGLGAERYLYAPHAGTFRTERALLDPIEPGDTAGWVNETPLKALAGGILRGLATSGLEVAGGAKLVEVDPTGDPANCRGIASRPARIAEGVLEAIDAFRARRG